MKEMPNKKVNKYKGRVGKQRKMKKKKKTEKKGKARCLENDVRY